MKMIFLDIDGVMNSKRNALRLQAEGVSDKLMRQFDPEAVQCLNRILNDTGAQIVISSTWRRLWSLDSLRSHFKEQGVERPERIVGETPTVFSGCRGREIELWLRDHDCDGFLILDDDSDMTPFMEKLVKTSFDNGLTATEANEVMERLS